MSLQAFRDAYAYDAGNSSFGEQQTSGLSAGKYTQYFSMTPRNGKSNVLGTVLKFVGSLTATGAKTPAAGTDALDLFIGGGTLSQGGDVEVAPAAGAGARCQTINRATAEFVWAASTNTAFTVAAAPTFVSAITVTVTAYLFVPLGGNASVVKCLLAGNILGVYSTNVTISYTSVTSYIVSSNFSGVVGFKEELTASLGSGLQSVLNYVPQTVSADAVFMPGETSTTITALNLVDIGGTVITSTVDTDVLQSVTALQFAPIAGATYTTTNGFVIVGDQKQFSIFQLTFANATTHYIAYLQVAGGEDVVASKSPNPTSAPPATKQVGAMTPSGGVATAYGTGGAGGRSAPGAAVSGGRGAIISRR